MDCMFAPRAARNRKGKRVRLNCWQDKEKVLHVRKEKLPAFRKPEAGPAELLLKPAKCTLDQLSEFLKANEHYHSLPHQDRLAHSTLPQGEVKSGL